MPSSFLPAVSTGPTECRFRPYLRWLDILARVVLAALKYVASSGSSLRHIQFRTSFVPSEEGEGGGAFGTALASSGECTNLLVRAGLTLESSYSEILRK